MQQSMIIKFNGQESSFKPTKINRSKLYGLKQRVPIDAQGQECSRAALTRDGKYILSRGSTAMLYLDKQGDVAERNQLRGVDADGQLLAPEESNSDTALEVAQVVQAADTLECRISHAYALEPVFICAELEESLSQGAIYRLPECNGRQVFLIGNDAGYFLLVGEHAGFEFIGLAEADLSPPDIGEDGCDFEDDIDFGMM